MIYRHIKVRSRLFQNQYWLNYILKDLDCFCLSLLLLSSACWLFVLVLFTYLNWSMLAAVVPRQLQSRQEERAGSPYCLSFYMRAAAFPKNLSLCLTGQNQVTCPSLKQSTPPEDGITVLGLDYAWLISWHEDTESLPEHGVAAFTI